MRVDTVVSTDRLAKFALNLKSNHYADGYWGMRPQGAMELYNSNKNVYH